MAASSGAGGPILVTFEVLFVRRIEARELRAVRDFIHDPGLQTLLPRGDANHRLAEGGWNQHRAVVVNDHKIVGIDAHAAAADGFLPIDEGETSDRGRGGCALTPDGEAGVEDARHVAHAPVGDKARHASLLYPRTEDIPEDAGVRDAHRVGHRDAAWRHVLNRRSRRARGGPGSRRSEVLTRRNEAQSERAPDNARLPGSNRSRSSHPDPAQSMLEQDGRNRRGRHGFQSVDDVAELTHISSGRTLSGEGGAYARKLEYDSRFGQCMGGQTRTLPTGLPQC